MKTKINLEACMLAVMIIKRDYSDLSYGLFKTVKSSLDNEHNSNRLSEQL